MTQMSKKWVALCSAAIGVIYGAGFYTTETSAGQAQVQQTATRQTEQPQQSQQPQTKKMYNEGTFTGVGSNRRGSIEVAVTIRNDKITKVEIANFGMHYPESDIAGLPNEVLRSQSAEVQNVSGATYSTEAFQDAVQDALAKAQNGSGK